MRISHLNMQPALLTFAPSRGQGQITLSLKTIGAAYFPLRAGRQVFEGTRIEATCLPYLSPRSPQFGGFYLPPTEKKLMH